MEHMAIRSGNVHKKLEKDSGAQKEISSVGSGISSCLVFVEWNLAL